MLAYISRIFVPICNLVNSRGLLLLDSEAEESVDRRADKVDDRLSRLMLLVGCKVFGVLFLDVCVA